MATAQRNQTLDAFRGISVLAMVLSGSIAYKILPAWMYHAQVPPPDHKFNGNIPGITWVDLVFPFFLFAMGAAIPFSLKKYIDEKKSEWVIVGVALKRFLLLAFFALFTNHMKAWAMAEKPTDIHHILSILAFILLFFIFMENKKKQTWNYIAKAAAVISSIAILYYLPFLKSNVFNFYKSDIILMVLANMALFGTLIYYFTKKNILIRVGILAFVMAVFLSASQTGDTWQKSLFEFKNIGKLNIDWLYKFYFLKYLFIVIPGTIVGQLWIERPPTLQLKQQNKTLVFIGWALVFANLIGLFTRLPFATFLFSSLYCFTAFYIVRNDASHLKTTVQIGIFMLLLGHVFEAYQGGIKKDSSTYSYYFITSGLAIFTLVSLHLASGKLSKHFISLLEPIGKNPMITYVAGNLLILPLLEITQLKPYWDKLNFNITVGILKGLLFTIVVGLVTTYFTRKKIFWKT